MPYLYFFILFTMTGLLLGMRVYEIVYVFCCDFSRENLKVLLFLHFRPLLEWFFRKLLFAFYSNSFFSLLLLPNGLLK